MEHGSVWEGRLSSDGPDTGEGQRLGAEPLEDFLGRTPAMAVAFSGGCDSAYLLAAARTAGCDVRAYRVDTAFQPAFEREDAQRVARSLDVALRTVELDMLSDGEVCANSPQRCLLCKRRIFAAIRHAVEEDVVRGEWAGVAPAGDVVLADGTNGSDDPLRRPGFLALAECGVVSPLRRGGLSKAQVRDGLRAAEGSRGLDGGALLSAKPSFPCLAAYVATGEPITAASLAAAARARGVAL